RAGSGPHGPLIRPSCETQGIRPTADPCEEVSVSVSHKLVWTYILDAPFIDYASGNVAFSPEFPQPSRSFGVELVVVDHRPTSRISAPHRVKHHTSRSTLPRTTPSAPR